MTKVKQKSRQLELPMLVDINQKVAAPPSSSTVVTSDSKSMLHRPTKQDISVYKEISSDYFQSLKRK